MDYQNQNEQERNEQGTFQQRENQSQQQGNDQMPTSAGGNPDYENQNNNQSQEGQQNQQGQQPQDRQQNWEQSSENGISEDAQSRMQDDFQNDSQPQIDEEGEFNNRTGWMREEGLSDDERRNAEEEDLDGRRSGDSSVL
jgi:Ca-activated chloride channel family protein